MTQYPVIRNPKYDFAGQSYADSYPNLHKYPATMLPQIGIEILRELGIHSGKLLDPYCGSGSSFAAGLECGITDMVGFDINPLAILISQAKFAKVDPSALRRRQQTLRDEVYEFVKSEARVLSITLPDFYNVNYWFSEQVLRNLSILKCFIDQIAEANIRRFFLVAFSETARNCSYVRNGEFKLFRIKPEDLLHFNPDVLAAYFACLSKSIEIYANYYYPKLSDDLHITLDYKSLKAAKEEYDVVLTSPPYGDSKTTVAYGQFSLFANEWLGIDYARRVDKMLMGGRKPRFLIDKGVIAESVYEISQQSVERAREVSAFYEDLQDSIGQVANTVKPGGKVIYVVGNRRVKNVQLPSDQFIAEKFEEKGFKHLVTYERQLSNKVMPSRNSPSNKPGDTNETMSQEFIVVCEKS